MAIISESMIVDLPDKPDINDIVVYLTAIRELNRHHKGDKILPFLGTERHNKNTEKIRKYLPFFILSNPKEIYDLLKEVYYETGDHLRLMLVIIEILNEIGKELSLTHILVNTVHDPIPLDIESIMKLIDRPSNIILEQIMKEGCSLQILYYFKFVVLYLQCQARYYLTEHTLLGSYDDLEFFYDDFLYHKKRFEIIGLKKENQVRLRVNILRLNKIDAMIGSMDYLRALNQITKIQKEIETKKQEFKEDDPLMYTNLEILFWTNKINLLVDEVSNGCFLPKKIPARISRRAELENAIEIGHNIISEFQLKRQKNTPINEMPLSLMYQIIRAEIVTGKVYGTKILENLSFLSIYGKRSGYELLSDNLKIEIGKIINPDDIHTIDIVPHHIERLDYLGMREASLYLRYVFSSRLETEKTQPDNSVDDGCIFVKTIIGYKDENTLKHINNMINVTIPEIIPHYCALLFCSNMIYFLSEKIDAYKVSTDQIEKEKIIEDAIKEGVSFLRKINDNTSFFIRKLQKHAIYHDVGKVIIPSELLKSELPLSLYDRSVIDMHPKLGEMISEGLSDYERSVIRDHHAPYSKTAKNEAFLVFDNAHEELLAFSHKLFLITMIRLADTTEAVSGQRNYQRDGISENTNELDIQMRMKIGMKRLLDPSFSEKNKERVFKLIRDLSPFELVVLGSYRKWVNSSLYEQIKEDKKRKTNAHTVFVSLIGDRDWWSGVFRDIEPLLEYNMNIANSIRIIESRIKTGRHRFDKKISDNETHLVDSLLGAQQPGIPGSE